MQDEGLTKRTSCPPTALGEVPLVPLPQAPGKAVSRPAGPGVTGGTVYPHVSVGRVTCPSCGWQLCGDPQRCGVSLTTGGIAPASLQYVRLTPVAPGARPRCLAGDPRLGCVPARLSSVVAIAPGDDCHGP